MTTYNKQIIVLGGEPSSTNRDVQELGLAYVLDTSKIRYPNDQQISSGDRALSNRRPNGGEKSGIPQSRGLSSRDGPPDAKRIGGPPRESTISQNNAYSRSN